MLAVACLMCFIHFMLILAHGYLLVMVSLCGFTLILQVLTW
jgi:hypothetical protein